MGRIPLWRRYARLFGPDPNADVNDELRFHLEARVDDLVAQGLHPAAARREAERQFGDVRAIQWAGRLMGRQRERTRERRDYWGACLQDLRYAIRGMRRSAAFTLAAVLTLGLGTGAISTVFTLANTLFFRELPVERPDRVVAVQATRRLGHREQPGWVGYPDYVHFRDRTKTLQGLAAHYSNDPVFVRANQQSKEMNGAVVSANFFALLGVKPALGRFFRPEEDTVPDRDRVAVLGYEIWRNWFGCSPDALGAKLKINGIAFTVIGIAPAAFRGITIQPDEIYIPLMMARAGYRWCADSLAVDCRPFSMVGRLAEGRTVEQASAEMATLLPPWWTAAQEGGNTGVKVSSARGVSHPDLVRSEEIRFIEVLSSVAGVLLLVCCVNLAGLLIARNSARTREFAIRASLGAGSLRLMRQLITESLLLAIGGGGLGILFSLVLAGALNSSFYSVDIGGRPLYYNFAPEPRVILAAIAISIGVGMLVGVVPALKSLRSDAAGDLKYQSSGVSAGPRFGRWLAGAQAGAAVALAAVAGLLTTSAHMLTAGVNFDASHVALLRLRPRLVQYSPEKAQQLVRAVMDRLAAAPAVESATMSGVGAILVGREAQVSLPEWPDLQALKSGYLDVGPRYFETLRIPMLRGREFDGRDTVQSPPVAIVSDTLARRLWPSGAAVGATLMVNRQPHQVVGIVMDVPLQSRGTPLEPFVYTPFWQGAAQVDAQLAVRVKGDAAAMLPALVREVNRVDPDVPIADTITLSLREAVSDRSLWITASFVSYAAMLAILLSGIGLYGALAFSVSRRTKEIGIRMAVGATSAEVLAMVVREGMSVILTGAVIGVGLATGATRLVRHLLYGSGAADAQVYAIAALVVASVGLFACWIPARRAARVEPVIALRDQ